jgi:protein transport protein SEC31
LWRFRFNRIAWGASDSKKYGIIAGGMESGELDLWCPEKALQGKEYVNNIITLAT